MGRYNRFLMVKHQDIIDCPGESKTIQGVETKIEEFLRSGTVESVQEKIRKRMLFGNRLKMEDLTMLDHFKYTITRYKNLTRSVSDSKDLDMRIKKQELIAEEEAKRSEVEQS